MHMNNGTLRKYTRLVDLSITIESGLPSDPPVSIPKVVYIGHAEGKETMKQVFPGIEDSDLPGGLGWAAEEVTLTTHSGTHMDAPYHYHPTQDHGLPSLTIDEIPLEWCFHDGVLLDFRHKGDSYGITVTDVEEELKRIGYEIKPMDIVLIQTGADALWGKSEYLARGPGMTREATLFLARKGIKVMGIDAWSFDRPLSAQARDFSETGDSKVIWEAHFAGIETGYCHMEKMANLSAIGRAHGFTVCCFPIKVKKAGAGWVRPVAMLWEE
jgi:kynurenine formamidase